MRGEEKSNYLNVMDKKILSSIKEAAWDDVINHIGELRQSLLEAEPSRADSNWNSAASAFDTSGSPEKKLASAVAEGYTGGDYLAIVPTSSGLLGDTHSRNIDLVKISGPELVFFDFKTGFSGEEICKALRQLMVHTALYRAFLDRPRNFGYNTERSPLWLSEAQISWELVGPKDMINPRRSEMRWGERDTQAMQKIMKLLGVTSFSLGRLQAESEALKSNVSKDNFSNSRARQWFENRTTVMVAG